MYRLPANLNRKFFLSIYDNGETKMYTEKLNIKDLRIAVFDWDNTLAESRSTLVFAIDRVLPEYGLPDWETVKTKRDNNLSFKDNFPRIFGDKAAEAYEKYVKIYLDNVGRMISAFPKTREVLDFLYEHGVSLMIMSNKDRNLLEYELPLLFDPKIFDNVVCGHEAKFDKPDGEHLRWTVKNVFLPDEIRPEKVWVIGDSPQDSRCAKNAGAQAIRIGRSIWGDEDSDLSGICFFDSFVDFYESLLSSN